MIPVGITAQSSEEQRKSLTDTADKVSRQLLERGMRAETDLRDNYSPGWKFNHWELKGVPIRVEVGPRDLAAHQVDILINNGNAKVTAVIRHSGEKKAIQLKGLDDAVEQLLVDIHRQMYDK